jgi:hypothetical protein
MRGHNSEGPKGRNNRNLPNAEILSQELFVSPLQGLFPDEQRPQGGVWRLTPPHLPWADMSRPFGAESTGLAYEESPAYPHSPSFDRFLWYVYLYFFSADSRLSDSGGPVPLLAADVADSRRFLARRVAVSSAASPVIRKWP